MLCSEVPLSRCKEQRRSTLRAKAAALAAALAALLAVCAPATAAAGNLAPQGKKVFFGISDTGDPADFGEFSKLTHKHPALIETFRTWGTDFPDSIERWQDARARPVMHISTADKRDGHELITPRAIARGEGDEYLIRLNKLFWAKGMRAYIRPLGRAEPLPQRLGRLRLRRRTARRRPQPAPVHPRLPADLRDRPRRRQAQRDRHPPPQGRPAAAAERRRRAAEGARSR